MKKRQQTHKYIPIWHSADGRDIKVSEMQQDHLLNTVAWIERRARGVQNSSISQSNLNPLISRIYPTSLKTAEIGEVADFLYPAYRYMIKEIRDRAANHFGKMIKDLQIELDNSKVSNHPEVHLNEMYHILSMKSQGW